MRLGSHEVNMAAKLSFLLQRADLASQNTRTKRKFLGVLPNKGVSIHYVDKLGGEEGQPNVNDTT